MPEHLHPTSGASQSISYDRTRVLSRSSGFSAVTFIFLFAFISYLILALAVPKVDWMSVGESPRIAASIARGEGFSSPFRQPTGPTALVPPVYPYLLAAIFRVFGIFTGASYWAAVALNIVVHALTCVILFWAAEEAFGRRAAWYAALALGCLPFLFEPLVWLHVLGGFMGKGLFIPPNAMWNTHLSELAIVLLIWLTLRRTHWAVYGAMWGLAALINPTVLALAPAFLVWRLWHHGGWRDMGLAIATAVLLVTPWLVRNHVVFHRLLFIRDGFGIELRVGNQPGNRGLWSANVHPDRSEYELHRLAEMGEPEYARVAGEEAMTSIRSHPAEFARDSMLRVVYFWIGTPLESHRLHALKFLKYLPQLAFSLLAFYGAVRALRHGYRQAQLFVAVLFFYPLVFYITHTFGDFFYQYPIQPEMLALAASVVVPRKHAKLPEVPPATRVAGRSV